MATPANARPSTTTPFHAAVRIGATFLVVERVAVSPRRPHEQDGDRRGADAERDGSEGGTAAAGREEGGAGGGRVAWG